MKKIWFFGACIFSYFAGVISMGSIYSSKFQKEISQAIIHAELSTLNQIRAGVHDELLKNKGEGLKVFFVESCNQVRFLSQDASALGTPINQSVDPINYAAIVSKRFNETAVLMGVEGCNL